MKPVESLVELEGLLNKPEYQTLAKMASFALGGLGEVASSQEHLDYLRKHAQEHGEDETIEAINDCIISAKKGLGLELTREEIIKTLKGR